MQQLTNNEAATIDELHRRVGRNLLMFQRIEQILRFILPYIHPEGSRKDADAMHTYQRTHVEGKSLGSLVKEFKESVRGSTELIESSLDKVLAARNDLVHYFYRNERFSLLEEDGLQNALTYLDEQHRNARVWDEISGAYGVALLTILIEQNSALAAELGKYRDSLVAQWPDWMDIVEWKAQ